MQKFSTATFSSSCSIPIRTYILGTKKRRKQNNQFISNKLGQANIVLSKTNFKCELLCSYCLHFLHFCRLLGVLEIAGPGGALNHWTNVVCSPCGSGAAWRCVQLRPMLTLLRGAGSRRAQCLDTPPAWCFKEGWARGCAESLDKCRLLGCLLHITLYYPISVIS